jgi:hypothetical protein
MKPFADLFKQYEDPRDLWEKHPEAREVLVELSKVCTFDEDGRHFTQFLKHWRDLEEAGLVEVYRPEHSATGIRYSQEFWSIQLTEAGQDTLETLMDAGLIG